jgi:hypothetical protein
MDTNLRYSILILRIASTLIPLAVLLHPGSAHAQKPKVWIYTDMTDKSLHGHNHMGTINDPDDISAMAGYLLMANHFETLGIVIGSTHRSEHSDTPHQEAWANAFFGEAYEAGVTNLNKHIGGYPDSINLTQSSIKDSAEKSSTNTPTPTNAIGTSTTSSRPAKRRRPHGYPIRMFKFHNKRFPAILTITLHPKQYANINLFHTNHRSLYSINFPSLALSSRQKKRPLYHGGRFQLLD